MAAVKNLKIYTGDLETLKEEYLSLGFDVSLDGGVLTVYALKQKKTKGAKPNDKKGNKR